MLWDTTRDLEEVSSFTERPEFLRGDERLVLPNVNGGVLYDLRNMRIITDLIKPDDLGPFHFFRYNGIIDYPSIRCLPDGRTICISHLHHSERPNAIRQWISDHLIKLSDNSSEYLTRIWSGRTGRELRTLPSLYDAQFSSDGKVLVTLDNGILTAWDMPPSPPLTNVLRVAGPSWLGLVCLIWLCSAWLGRRAAAAA
jgi:hypothetical protein